jgi:hypothetical protein
MITISSIYTKEGATFTSGEEAYANKNSLYGPELTAAVDACYAQMLADGVFVSPIALVWDQATSTLTITKTVTSLEDYNAALTFDISVGITRGQEAGWTSVAPAPAPAPAPAAP